MTAELTSEEIVTKLLCEHQILERSQNNFYISNPKATLGEYLLNLPQDEIVEDETLNTKIEENSRFSFISGKWII